MSKKMLQGKTYMLKQMNIFFKNENYRLLTQTNKLIH